MCVTMRSSHLVGSIPAASATEAMEFALSHLGDTLRTLPDGETGERGAWIVNIVEGMRAHPDLELRKDGTWSSYDDVPTFRVKKGRTLEARTLDLGHVRAFEDSYPRFTASVQSHGRADLSFQVGVPGDFDMALMVLGPRGAFTNRRPFTEATVGEIRAIHGRAGDAVVFQIELPLELGFVAGVPVPLRRPLAAYLARGVVNLVRSSPAGARFGLHLCLGDMNHEAHGSMKDARPLVTLSNAIAKRWPSGRALEFIHAPFAAGAEPPPTDPQWYSPLKGLRVPPEVRFIAGFAHEDQDVATQRELRALIESAAGRSVDIAASCGLGRRDPEAAASAMRRMVELTAD
jgi:hypothetical protein